MKSLEKSINEKANIKDLDHLKNILIDDIKKLFKQLEEIKVENNRDEKQRKEQNELISKEFIENNEKVFYKIWID